MPLRLGASTPNPSHEIRLPSGDQEPPQQKTWISVPSGDQVGNSEFPSGTSLRSSLPSGSTVYATPVSCDGSPRMNTIRPLDVATLPRAGSECLASEGACDSTGGDPQAASITTVGSRATRKNGLRMSTSISPPITGKPVGGLRPRTIARARVCSRQDATSSLDTPPPRSTPPRSTPGHSPGSPDQT